MRQRRKYSTSEGIEAEFALVWPRGPVGRAERTIKSEGGRLHTRQGQLKIFSLSRTVSPFLTRINTQYRNFMGSFTGTLTYTTVLIL